MRLRRPRRLALTVVLTTVGVVALATAWVGVRGLMAGSDLVAAQESLRQARAALLAGDDARARRALRVAQDMSTQARTRTHDPVWAVASAVPWVGDTPGAVRDVAASVDRLTHGALPALVRTAGDVNPGELRLSGSRVDVARLEKAAPSLARAERLLARERREEPGGGDWVAGPVADAVTDYRTELRDLHGSLRGAATAARLLPPMLGADGPRRYFLAFQNNAEARGTGGLLGAYGILEARDGRLRLTHLGPNTELDSARALPVDLGDGFAERYGNDPALWVNANMSPHFPYAARIWEALWERQHGQRLDGVVATDPVALGYVLDATGGFTLADGTEVTGRNASSVALRDVYARFPDPAQNPSRDLYLQQIAKGAFDRLFSGEGDPRALVDAFARAAGEGRLLVHSTHAAEQATLADTGVGGTLSSERGSRVSVVLNNVAGSKLDYYLDRDVTYTAAACDAGDGAMRESRVTVTVRNTAPRSGLPEYVAIRADPHAAETRVAEGANRVRVSVFGPVGSGMRRATLDGRQLLVSAGEERGRPTYDFSLDIAPGRSRTAVLELTEPAAGSAVQIHEQPLVQPQHSTAREVAGSESCTLPDVHSAAPGRE